MFSHGIKAELKESSLGTISPDLEQNFGFLSPLFLATTCCFLDSKLSAIDLLRERQAGQLPMLAEASKLDGTNYPMWKVKCVRTWWVTILYGLLTLPAALIHEYLAAYLLYITFRSECTCYFTSMHIYEFLGKANILGSTGDTKIGVCISMVSEI